MEIGSERVVTNIDSRTHSNRQLHTYQIIRTYSAVFLQLAPDLTENEAEDRISALKNRLRSELFLEPEELEFEYFQDERLGAGILLIDTTGHELARFIYEHLVFTSGSLAPSENSQALSQVPFGHETYSFKRLPIFLNRYHTTVAVVTDLHLDGTPFVVHGKEVDFRSFWEQVIGAIREALDNASGRILLVFLGDTYDKTQVVDREETNKQLDTLQEIYYKNNLHNKTVFLLGNHDARSDIYAWKLPVKTCTELVLDISKTRRLFLLHGNNCGLEQWMGKKTLTEEDIKTIRNRINHHKQFSKDENEKMMVRLHDLVGIGHLHTIGIVNLAQKFLAVPPMRKILKEFPSGKFGCLGLFGYGTEGEPDDWDIKIDRIGKKRRPR